MKEYAKVGDIFRDVAFAKAQEIINTVVVVGAPVMMVIWGSLLRDVYMFVLGSLFLVFTVISTLIGIYRSYLQKKV